MKLYKVLEKDLISPHQKFPYELDQQYVCYDFDTDKSNECSRGYYAVDIEGLIYCFNTNRKIFEVEVSGKKVEIDQFKRRYEKIKIIKECSHREIEEKAKLLDSKLGYKLSEALFPVDPLRRKKKPRAKDIENLKLWASVRPSVWASVWPSVRASVWPSVWPSVWDSVSASVWPSVWDSVRDSVRASVWDSVRASVWRASVGDSVWDSVSAYTSSLFPNIKKWKYIDHDDGANPFQPCIDLWTSGFVPSYDGQTWRLHSGKKAEIVYTLKQGEIR